MRPGEHPQGWPGPHHPSGPSGFECMEHRREYGRAVLSSEESDGSSSVDDSSLWTEEFDELESISLMDDDLEVLPLEPMLAPSRAPPPVGEGAIL